MDADCTQQAELKVHHRSVWSTIHPDIPVRNSSRYPHRLHRRRECLQCPTRTLPVRLTRQEARRYSSRQRLDSSTRPAPGRRRAPPPDLNASTIRSLGIRFTALTLGRGRASPGAHQATRGEKAALPQHDESRRAELRRQRRPRRGRESYHVD